MQISPMQISHMEISLTNKETNLAMITNKSLVEADREIEVQSEIFTEDRSMQIHKVTKSTNPATEEKTTSLEVMHIHTVLLNVHSNVYNVAVNLVDKCVAKCVAKCVVTLLDKFQTHLTVHYNTQPYAILPSNIISHHILRMDREEKILKYQRGL